MDRLQDPSQPGGQFRLMAFQDFGYTGEYIAQWRERGLFESQQPVVKFFDEEKVTSNQIFHVLFNVGGSLNPTHCFNVLSWFGLLGVDNRPFESISELLSCSAFKSVQKRSQITLQLGFAPPAAQTICTALFAAWRNSVDLFVNC